LKAFSSELTSRVAAHKGRRIYGAITNRWLCAKTASVCAEDAVPAGGDDDYEDEEEEL